MNGCGAMILAKVLRCATDFRIGHRHVLMQFDRKNADTSSCYQSQENQLENRAPVPEMAHGEISFAIANLSIGDEPRNAASPIEGVDGPNRRAGSIDLDPEDVFRQPIFDVNPHSACLRETSSEFQRAA